MGYRAITRSEWGARFRDGFGSRPLPATWLFAHHSVTASPGPNATLAQDIAAVRRLEDIGQARFGGGSSYGYAFMESGRVFQTLSLNRIGAHTRGYNTTGIGVVFVGNYENMMLNAKVRAAFLWLVRLLRVERYVVVSNRLRGHFEVSATACPGRNIRSQLTALESESRQLPPTPKPTPTPPEEVDMAAINRVVIAFVRPEKVSAVIRDLRNKGHRAYEADADEARITRRHPSGTPQ